MEMKFKRQKPLGQYIVDFICHEHNLIIEVDGGQHQDSADYDRLRDAWLRDQGYTVLRFWNNDVLRQTEGVLDAIRVAVQVGEGRRATALQTNECAVGE